MKTPQKPTPADILEYLDEQRDGGGQDQPDTLPGIHYTTDEDILDNALEEAELTGYLTI